MIKTYLAGPMRGLENFGFNEFETGKTYLQWLGHEVVSPHDLDILAGNVYYHRRRGVNGYGDWVWDYEWVELSSTFDMVTALRMDVSELAKCDAITLLPGWEHSEGCAVERAVANLLHLPIYYVLPWKVFSTGDPNAVENFSCRT